MTIAYCVIVLILLGSTQQNEEEENQDVKGIFDFFTRKTTTSTPAPATTDGTCNCKCGVRNEGGRIVGGAETAVNEFPWLVRLSYNRKFFCGGTLVSDRHVVTASHCVLRLQWFFIQVTFGEYDRCNSPTKPETRYVLRATVGSPLWNLLNGDIALLRLNNRVPISDVIRPICLPQLVDELYESKMAIVTGWGKKSESDSTTCIPHAVELPILTNTECKDKYGEMILDNMMCAGIPEGGKDSCQGDSGGPLVVKREDNTYELAGVISWGFGCGRPGNPGVYTRVTHFIKWIRSKAEGGCFCPDTYSPTVVNDPVTDSFENNSTEINHANSTAT